MKLVTDAYVVFERHREILIHTSVKLVTISMVKWLRQPLILIHTSVKLVTAWDSPLTPKGLF